MTDKPTPTDAATPECLTCSDHGAVGNILTAEPCPDCTRLNAQPAPATQQAGEPECYKWEHYCRWGHGWGWGECESEYDPRLPENKQYHTEDFNDPEQVRNFRALYRHTPPSLPTAQADSVLEDAARYRYLRDGDWREHEKLEAVIRLQLNALWDETIDAARKQGASHD